MISMLICIGGMALAAVVAFFIGFVTGNDDGRRTSRRQRDAYLQARIDGANKGVVPLSISLYEEHACSTIKSGCYGTADWFAHITAKLAGETGEFMEHYGKAMRDDDWSPFKDGVKNLSAERRENLLKELGDICWYVVVIAKELGSNMTEVLLLNVKKREGRKQRGTLKGAGDNR